MAATWARAEVQLDADGDSLVSQTRVFAQKAGDQGGVVAGKSFSRSLKDTLKGETSGFGSVMRNFFRDSLVQPLRRAGITIGRDFRGAMNGLRENAKTNFDFIKGSTREWASDFREKIRGIGLSIKTDWSDGLLAMRDSARDSFNYTRGLFRRVKFDADEATEAVDRHSSSWERLKNMIGGFLGGAGLKLRKWFGGVDEDGKKVDTVWKGLSANSRQWILIIGAIIGGLQQMAVLGSAAGAGIFVLGGALTSLLVGAGALIAVIVGLSGAVEDLPEAVRPAGQAFKDLMIPLNELQDFLLTNSLDQAEGAFRSMGETIRGLIPAFQPVADAIGNIIQKLADGLAPGTAGFENLRKVIEQSGPDFEKMMDIVGKIGGILLEAFANPVMQKAVTDLLDGTSKLVDKFGEWVSSDEFVSFIEQGSRVLEHFGGLISGVSRVLNNLVTDEAVERTVSFLDNLTAAMPFFQSLIEVFGELDVFGLLAEVFNTVGNAIRPILELLQPLAAIINDLLIAAFQNLGIIINLITPFFFPLRLILEILSVAVQKFTEYLLPFQEQMNAVGDAISTAADDIWTTLEPAIGDLMDAIIEMLPSPQEFAAFVTDTLIPAIMDFAHWLADEAVPAIQEVATWIRTDLVPAMQGFWDFLEAYIFPALENMVKGFDTAKTAIGIFVGVVQNMVSVLTWPVRKLTDLFEALFGAANSAAGAAANAGGGGGGPASQRFAAGGLLFGPTRILAGEDGPEAIIPLNRSLNRVDPSVRWLSAIAQGKGAPAMAGGGVVGGRGMTVESGAIVVQEAGDANAAANAILRRLAEYANG